MPLEDKNRSGNPLSPDQFFSRLSRPYTAADIARVQSAFAQSYGLFTQSDFYRFLITSQEEHVVLDPAEQEAFTREFSRLALYFFRRWTMNVLKRSAQLTNMYPDYAEIIEVLNARKQPETLEELRQLFRDVPHLHDVSPLNYQKEVGEASDSRIPFLHCYLERASYPLHEYDPIEMRIYINPQIAVIPQVIAYLAHHAERQTIPLYFKMIDYSYRYTEEHVKRLDKVIIYATKADTLKLLLLLEKLQRSEPDWFAGQETPFATQSIGEGVGLAADLTEQQEAQSPRAEVSFSAHRALFLEAVWTEAIRLRLLNQRDLKLSQATLGEIFSKNVKRLFPMQQAPFHAEIEKMFWDAQLDREKLPADKKDQFAVELKLALVYTMTEVFPAFSPESLESDLQKVIADLAPSFGIDPNNIAFNK